jgi:hypothetical protein
VDVKATDTIYGISGRMQGKGREKRNKIIRTRNLLLFERNEIYFENIADITKVYTYLPIFAIPLIYPGGGRICRVCPWYTQERRGWKGKNEDKAKSG